jgi:type 2 lantibiotic biosynthesis protein LanM
MTTAIQQLKADNDVLRAVAMAASPTERLQCPAFVVGPNGRKEAGRRAARWEEAVAAGERRRLDPARRALGLDREADARAFGDAEVSDPEMLPGWAKALVGWLGGLSDAEAGPGPFWALSVGARAWLTKRRSGSVIQLEDSAMDDLAAGLEARLWRACAAGLDYEARVAAELARVLRPSTGSEGGLAALDGGLDAWRGRLAQLPGLARVLGVIYHHWRRSTGELLTRLSTDLPLVRREVFDGRDPGPLVGVQLDLGDLHGGGRAVALLTFAEGARLFYKPKDLRVAQGFLELADFLNRRGLSPELPRWRFVLRHGYAWEEAVEHAPCDEPDGLSRFYARLGTLARLFQLLGARDMWLDNLVAAGERPAFIDLETMLQPAPPLSGARATPTDPHHAAATRWLASVAPLDMLAMVTPIGPGVPAEELGVLAPPGAFRSPFRYRLGEAPADRQAVSPEGYILWHHTQHAPRLAGQALDPAGFFPQIVDGYRALQEALVQSQGELAMAGGPLAALRSAPVRFIPRDTWTYLRLIDQSLDPPFLADPLARECLLARLFGAPPPGTAEERGAEVVACEIEALRDLDVPYFTSDPATTSVRDPRGVVVDGVFPADASSRLRARVAELRSFPLAEEVALLRSTLATSAAGRSGQPVPARRSRPQACRIGADELVDQATRIGEVILGAAIDGPDGSLSWLGLVDQPLLGCRQLLPVGGDLLSGTGGVALMFGELFAATQEPRWRRAAERAVEGVVATVKQAPESLGRLVERADNDRLPMVCGLIGVGGAIYALRALARSLHEPRLLDEAARATGALPLRELGRRAPLDVVVGGAGLLLALDPFEQGGDAKADQRASEVLAEGLFERAQESIASSVLVGPPVLWDQLPDPRAALGLAASRLTNGQPGVGRELITKLVDEAELDLAGGGPSERLGRVFCALSMPRRLLGPGRVRGWIDALVGRRLPPADAPTRVLLDECELMLLLERHGDPSARERACGLVEPVMARKEETGTWFPETVAADQHCLSTLDGLPALVHTFLRLAGHGDGAHGSIRTLELGGWP